MILAGGECMSYHDIGWQRVYELSRYRLAESVRVITILAGGECMS